MSTTISAGNRQSTLTALDGTWSLRKSAVSREGDEKLRVEAHDGKVMARERERNVKRLIGTY